jgi:peptidoglycan/LPS O-acetylase OafA/YrhL
MSSRLQHIHQLDSIRALAAFAVIFHHFLPEFNLGHFSYGSIGVDVFFAISGYLITAVLLEQKSTIGNRLLIVRNFIIKRALRLFPAYYLFISFFFALMVVLGLYVWDHGNEIYFYTYTQNILFFMDGMKGVQTNHLWTLAVEEQFYLIWPWIVIYFSNKNLMRILVVAVPITLFFKSFSGIHDLKMLTVSHVDTLGGGALIALLIKEKGNPVFAITNRARALLISFSLAVCAMTFFYELSPFFIHAAILVLSLTLVIGCYYSFGGVVGKVFNLSYLQYLGKISYGIYLYHKPIPYLLKLVLGKLQMEINEWALLSISLFLTVLIALLSYTFLERYFLRLKEKFDL